MLVKAIADSDCISLAQAIDLIGKEELTQMTFDHGMNVLNLAIDQESVDCVKQLWESYRGDPEVLKSLVEHRYAKEM
jgi:hypothetical protein